MNQVSKTPSVVVIDANVLIGICTKETKAPTALAALADYIKRDFKFHAPGVIVSEFLYIACKKVDDGSLTVAQHDNAVEDFNDYMNTVTAALDVPFIKRASEIRKGYGCSRANDSLYIALAEELAKTSTVEIVTFDVGMVNQVGKSAPSVKVNLLPV